MPTNELIDVLTDITSEIRSTYRRRLKPISRRYDSDDLIQDIGRRIVLGGHRCTAQTREGQQAYLRVAARNTFLGAIATHRGARMRSVRQEISCSDEIPLLSGRSVNSLDGLCHRETLAEVMEAIESLTARQRQALVMRAIEGREYSDIANQLGTTVTGARSLMANARRRVAVLLTGESSPA